MVEVSETLNHDSQMETLLNQMRKRLYQLEQETNKMRTQNIQYQHQIEAHVNEQTPSSSRFCTNIWSMASLETPIETVTNIQASGAGYNPTNNPANQNQEELIAQSLNTV